MTYLAIDYGVRRLGLAVSDDAGRLALPLGTHTRRPNDHRGDIAALLGWIRTREVEALVLGIPSGSTQSDETAVTARRFTTKLVAAAREAGIELAFFETDERFSTALAQNDLRAAGISTRDSRESTGADAIDARAAAVFLQSFLDERSGTKPPARDEDLETDDYL